MRPSKETDQSSKPKTTLLSLPNEILLHIFSHIAPEVTISTLSPNIPNGNDHTRHLLEYRSHTADQKTLHSLTLVNQRLNPLASSLLYKNIWLKYWRLEGFSHGPSASLLVRENRSLKYIRRLNVVNYELPGIGKGTAEYDYLTEGLPEWTAERQKEDSEILKDFLFQKLDRGQLRGFRSPMILGEWVNSGDVSEFQELEEMVFRPGVQGIPEVPLDKNGSTDVSKLKKIAAYKIEYMTEYMSVLDLVLRNAKTMETIKLDFDTPLNTGTIAWLDSGIFSLLIRWMRDPEVRPFEMPGVTPEATTPIAESDDDEVLILPSLPLPRLKTLHLSSLEAIADSSTSPALITQMRNILVDFPLPQLTTLILHDCDIWVGANLFELADQLSSLTHLEIRGYWDPLVVNHILQAIPSSLEHLFLFISYLRGAVGDVLRLPETKTALKCHAKTLKTLWLQYASLNGPWAVGYGDLAQDDNSWHDDPTVGFGPTDLADFPMLEEFAGLDGLPGCKLTAEEYHPGLVPKIPAGVKYIRCLTLLESAAGLKGVISEIVAERVGEIVWWHCKGQIGNRIVVSVGFCYAMGWDSSYMPDLFHFEVDLDGWREDGPSVRAREISLAEAREILPTSKMLTWDQGNVGDEITGTILE